MGSNTITVSVLAETSKFRKGMRELGNMGKMAVGAMGLVAAAAGAIGFAKLAGDAVAASDATDKFKKTLDFAGLKTDKIDALTKSTRAYADQTVYSLTDVQSITAGLAANGVKNFETLGESLGNLNAVTGGNAETYKRLGSVMTQTAGAGKLTTENWNQLADAIPGASGILQETLKKNGAYTGDFRTAMSKGQISAEEFAAAVQELGQTEGAKNAAKDASTIEGAWGNLQATIVGGMSDLIDKGKPFITDTMGKLSGAFKTFGEFLKDDLIPSLEGFSEWITANKDVIGTIAAVVGGAAAAWAIWTGAIAAWTAITTAATAVQAAFSAVLALNPVMLVVIAIAALVAGLVYFFTQTEVGRKAWATFTAFLSSSWKGFTEFITRAWNDTIAFFSGLPGKIKAIFAGALTWLTNAGKSAIDGLKNGVTGAWNAVAAWFRSIPGMITGAIGNPGAILSGAGAAIMNGFLAGLRNSWKAVTDFVGGIATWIRNNKGPLSYDYKLLQPAGKAIMGGFGDALENGFTDVQRMVSGFAPGLSDALGGTFSGDLAMAAASGSGNTFYSFDGISFSSADAQEASVLDEFAQFLRRKARAA